MNKSLIISVVFTLIVGLGLGFAVGRNQNPFTPGAKPMTQTTVMQSPLNDPNKDYDLQFIDAMIEHHQGAIMMANEAMEKSKRPEVLKMAHEIIAAQSKEITLLEQWKKDWYGDR